MLVPDDAASGVDDAADGACANTPTSKTIRMVAVIEIRRMLRNGKLSSSDDRDTNLMEAQGFHVNRAIMTESCY